MTFLTFRSTFSGYRLFSTQQIETKFPGFDRKVLVNWQRKGYIQKIRNSWYRFKTEPLSEDDLFFIANKIYKPSYISLESALSYYQLIPEGVFAVTSVSSLKTHSFRTPTGNFRYQHVKPAFYFGYRLIQSREAWYKMAEPEKAILDYLYLNPSRGTKDQAISLRIASLVWEKLIDMRKMLRYAKHMDSKALVDRLQTFTATVHAEPV